MTAFNSSEASALATLRLRKAASARCLFLDLMELSAALAQARTALVGLDATIRDAGATDLQQAIDMALSGSFD